MLFLISGMLPLGPAMGGTGAAEQLAGGPTRALTGHGPWAAIAGLFPSTALGTAAVPA